ncbi:hypothetical protein EYF80_037869 [Liparis tanakae]|uniref:Uncharacterized protein n=1 Tax=Liparis tanakae TaxID=230148 RepID=A0A4Z2GH23_9TELE|nr:hypothetical protein EYF80_037869 [Liparis tanakae]
MCFCRNDQHQICQVTAAQIRLLLLSPSAERSDHKVPMGGSFLLSPATLPRRMSLTDTFLMLNPTLSPGWASVRASWCISTDFTSVDRLQGAKVTTMMLLVPIPEADRV